MPHWKRHSGHSSWQMGLGRDGEMKAQRGIGTARRDTSIRAPRGWPEKAGTWLYPPGNSPRIQGDEMVLNSHGKEITQLQAVG